MVMCCYCHLLKGGGSPEQWSRLTTIRLQPGRPLRYTHIQYYLCADCSVVTIPLFQLEVVITKVSYPHYLRINRAAMTLSYNVGKKSGCSKNEQRKLDTSSIT